MHRCLIRRSRPLLALAFGLNGFAVSAHDFWIEPSTFHATPGQVLQATLRVGDAFPGDAVPRMTSRIERFALVSPQGDLPFTGSEGAQPAGAAQAPGPGIYVAVYDSNHASIVLEGPKFEQHLHEQGLEAISALRRRAGRTSKSAREIYSRGAKAIVRVGDVSGTGHDQRVGLPLELVPESDPGLLGQGGALTIQLFFRGQPLPGALVSARSPDTTETRSGRTDDAGRFVFDLPQPGVWLVKAVHMVAAEAGTGADWESFWASLTFELPRPAAGSTATGPR